MDETGFFLKLSYYCMTILDWYGVPVTMVTGYPSILITMITTVRKGIYRKKAPNYLWWPSKVKLFLRGHNLSKKVWPWNITQSTWSKSIQGQPNPKNKHLILFFWPLRSIFCSYKRRFPLTQVIVNCLTKRSSNWSFFSTCTWCKSLILQCKRQGLSLD